MGVAPDISQRSFELAQRAYPLHYIKALAFYIILYPLTDRDNYLPPCV